MTNPLQHDTGPQGGQPCMYCGLIFSPKVAYVACLNEGETILDWWRRQSPAVHAHVHPAVRAAVGEVGRAVIAALGTMEKREPVPEPLRPSEPFPPNTALGRRVGIERDDKDDR